jgi:methylglyoxal reductase
MKYKKIGNTELEASVIGLGTFEIGGSSWWDKNDDNISVKTIQNAIDKGINFIDTAPVYGYGHSERIVGRAIKGKRSNIILSTKVGEEFTGENEGRFHYFHDKKNVYTCLTKESIIRQLEQSLKNLKTDYIDIYSPHFYFDDISVGSIESIMEALLELKKQGKIRYVALSNIEFEQLKKFNEINSLGICGMQLYCNALDSEIINSDIHNYLINNGLSCFGINSLAKGLLAGAYSNNYIVKSGSERSESPWFYENRISKVNDLITSWSNISDKYEISKASLAISWVLSQNGFTHVIAGATNPDHIISNILASEVTLLKEEVEYIHSTSLRLKNECVYSQIINVKDMIFDLITEKTPVIIWGAGVTLDYISRKIPIQECNIIGILDSNENLINQERFGVKVSKFVDLQNYPPNCIVLVMIPLDENYLNNILNKVNNRLKIIHMGYLKALCK